ncbi:uncharacterized protein LOC135811666 [Sycon ciliatum]|uniref:uncharacterized protein LOC135811666 n=1 Tax=Sycon ciliatum TaxID=27933 RepID=UPI0031F630EA
MKASVLGGTTAVIVAFSLLCTVPHANMLPNCAPEDGDIRTYENWIYIQPEIDEKAATLYSGTAKRYNKTFTFTSPCHLLFKAISLMYFGSCSVAVSLGSDNNIKFLQTLPFPASRGQHWNTGLERLTVSVTKTLQEYMTGIKRRQLMISVYARKAHCEIYPVEHIALARGLTIIAQGTVLSGRSHPWIIAFRKSTIARNRPDPINQFYENHNCPDGADQEPTAELTDPGLYSAVGPGYSHPTNRPKTPPDKAAALYDSCTENETYTYATRDGSAPANYINTETRQKDDGEPYASVQPMFDQSTEDVQSHPKSQQTETARQDAKEAPAVCYSVPQKEDTTGVRRHYENAEERTATKRDEQPRTTHSIETICRATDVKSLRVLSKSAQSAQHNHKKCINPDDVERRGLGYATPVVCRNAATTNTSTNQQSSRLSLPATYPSTPTGSDTHRCVSPSQVPRPLPYQVFKVLKDSQGDYTNQQDTVSSNGAQQSYTDTDPNIYAKPALSLSDNILFNATTLGKREDVGGTSTLQVNPPDPSAIYAVPQKANGET